VLSCIGVSCLSAFLKNSLRRSWKVWGLVAVVLTALASSGYAYWTSNSPSPSLYVTATKPPIEVRMELDKTEFQLNETIVVRLFLRNIGSEAITLVFHYKNFIVGFVVKYENDTRVFEHPSMYLCAIEEVVLEPGDQISAKWWDSMEWDQKGLHGDYYGRLVPPGTYKIIGQTGYHHIKGIESPEKFETPPITIVIS
jgi:hypothetical protein